MKNKTIYIIFGFIIIIVAAGAFFGGMQYQKTQRSNNAQFAGQGRGQGGQFQRRLGANGGAVVGEITSQDDTSITVKLPDGSSKIVILSASTAINKQAAGAKSDLKTGERVAVFGTTNADGSVTAQNVQLNPQMRGFQRALSPTQQAQ